jgi:3'(2'), 5'-bisphosphate nucleotidase
MHELLPDVTRIAREAGEAILAIYSEVDMQVDYKTDNSPLTQADLASHRHIVASLQDLTPHIPILSEESPDIDTSTRQEWQTFWLVDPLDGTKEFVQRNGEFTVNIALVSGHRPVLGVVHVPVLDLTYWAAEGQGAFRAAAQETLPLHANGTLGRPLRIVASRSHAGPATEAFLKNLEHDYALEVVSKGSSLKFCLVAEGSADLYPRLGPTMEWDTAAAQCIVAQAGGQVTTLKKTPLQYNKTDLLNPYFVVSSPAMQAIWQRYLHGVALERHL